MLNYYLERDPVDFYWQFLYLFSEAQNCTLLVNRLLS